MKLITGTGVAASALLIAGGTSAVALAQTASAHTSPLGVQSSVGSTQDATDFDATEIDHWKSEAAAEAVDPARATELAGSAALGQAHTAAMQAWAQCVGDAGSGQKTMTSQTPPKLACGEKPMAPGVATQLTQQTAPTPSVVPDTATESDAPDTHTGDSTDGSTTETEHSGSHESSDHQAGSGDHTDGGDQTAGTDAVGGG